MNRHWSSFDRYGSNGTRQPTFGSMRRSAFAYTRRGPRTWRTVFAITRSPSPLRPQSPGAHLMLANALKSKGYRTRPNLSTRRQYASSPDYAPAYFNLGQYLGSPGGTGRGGRRLPRGGAASTQGWPSRAPVRTASNRGTGMAWPPCAATPSVGIRLTHLLTTASTTPCSIWGIRTAADAAGSR